MEQQDAPPSDASTADDTATVPVSGDHRPGWALSSLHVVGLCAFAVAQPLFAKLGNNATFFVAHRVDGVGIVMWALALLLVPPALFMVVEMVARLAGRTAREVTHAALIGVLGAVVLAGPVAKGRDFGIGGSVVVIVAAAAAIAVGYWLLSWIRSFVTFASAIAPIAFLLILLFATPVNDLVFPASQEASAAVSVSHTSVLLLGFDEFALGSILKPDGSIDSERFPGFARLASESSWFPNATGIAPATHIAYPGILTGHYTDWNGVPDWHYYPQNLFSLLGRSHELNVHETLTRLCSETLCKNTAASDTECRGRRVVASDTAIVLSDTLLSTRAAGDLDVPPLNDRWCNFRESAATGAPPDEPGATSGSTSLTPAQRKRNLDALVNQDLSQNQAARFQSLLSDITKDAPPSLWYLHATLPHVPWQFLPDGESYAGSGIPGLNLDNGQWPDNEYLVHLAQQRELLQTKFADHLVSKLLDRLHATGQYDKTLLIVTADHGVGFGTNGFRREPKCAVKQQPVCDPTNIYQIVPVPMFVKTPFQKSAAIDRRFAESIDIVPTIAQVLKTKVPWKVDGHSLLDPDFHRRHRFYESKSGRVQLPDKLDIARLSRQIEDTFGAFGGADDLYAFGPHRKLLSKPVTALPGGATVTGLVVKPNDLAQYDRVKLKSGYVPARFQARVDGAGDDRVAVAVAINGTIAGVGETFRDEHDDEGATQIDVMLAPRWLRDGRNDVRVFAIDDDTLRPLTMEGAIVYRVDSSDGAITAVSSSRGGKWRARNSGTTARIDDVHRKSAVTTVDGWALDPSMRKGPDLVLVVVDGNVVAVGSSFTERADVAKNYPTSAAAKPGFAVSVPNGAIPDAKRVQVIALFGSNASVIGR